jgi:hypothetical protein
VWVAAVYWSACSTPVAVATSAQNLSKPTRGLSPIEIDCPDAVCYDPIARITGLMAHDRRNAVSQLESEAFSVDQRSGHLSSMQ